MRICEMLTMVLLVCGHGCKDTTSANGSDGALDSSWAGDSHDVRDFNGDDSAGSQDTGGDGASGSCSESQLVALEQKIAAALNAAATDQNITTEQAFTLILERTDGRVLTLSNGGSTLDTVYESASTSKWVTAVVLLDLVDQGKLGLDDRAKTWISFWREDTVTLRHLLSFTSGYSDEPFCINSPASDFTSCVEKIYDKNSSPAQAGSEFFYSSSHMQIAGLMAINASGLSSWSEVFSSFQQRSGLFPSGRYDLPSDTNPRLAGGMHWTGREYHAFLRGLYHGTLLSELMRQELFADQRGAATVAQSPSVMGVQEDWSYGLGNWLECPTAIAPSPFDCGSGHRNSSPGAYGAYPFIDFDHGYFGILARQGSLGTFREGLRMFRVVADDVARWADNQC